jgi:exoribonuclease-2
MALMAAGLSGVDGPPTRREGDRSISMSKSEHKSMDLVSIARDVAIREGFVVDFPAGLGDPADDPPEQHSSVVDERHLLWSSVDNRESTDLDQIEVAERLANDVIRVKLGIADVDAYVPRGSVLDGHAGANTTSLYAGIATFPMLPDAFSSGATSLLAGEERLAVVTEIDVARDGSICGSRVYEARVKNHTKLVYEAVGAWLEDHGGPPPELAKNPALAEQVRMQDEAAQRLRRRRIDHGALQLETVEARAVAKGGEVVDLELTLKSRARELVEDLMIAANGATARWLEDRRIASLRRVVRKPKRWDRIVALAGEHGFALPEEPDPIALSDFLSERRAADPSRFADVSLSVVKLLGPGEYAVADPDSPEGHFGLAVDDYAHSTAPNRRYGDLVTQRLLKAAARVARIPYTAKELAAIAARCTEREDHARKFERTMRKVAAALFLSKRIGATFDAVVTGVSSKGTFVRTVDPPAEGRVVDGELGLDVGDRTRVRLVATEPTRGFIDFVRVRH